jgi:hypothetical protein
VSTAILGRFTQTFCVCIFGIGIQILSFCDAIAAFVFSTEVTSLISKSFFVFELLLNCLAPFLLEDYCYLSFVLSLIKQNKR